MTILCCDDVIEKCFTTGGTAQPDAKADDALWVSAAADKTIDSELYCQQLAGL